MPKRSEVVSSNRPKGIAYIVFYGTVLTVFLGVVAILLTVAYPGGFNLGYLLGPIIYNVASLLLLNRMKKSGYWLFVTGCLVAIVSTLYIGLLDTGIMHQSLKNGWLTSGAVLWLAIPIFFSPVVGLLMIGMFGISAFYVYSKRQMFK